MTGFSGEAYLFLLQPAPPLDRKVRNARALGAAHECGEEMLATLASWLDATLDPGDGGARRTFRLADERGWREL